MANPVGNPKRCKGCQKPIFAGAVWAMGGMCHVDCLVCCQCQKNINDPREARMDEQQVKCLACYNDSHGIQPCCVCKKPINDALENPVSTGSQQFHQQCFRCHSCDAPMSPGFYFTDQEHNFCGSHCITEHFKRAEEAKKKEQENAAVVVEEPLGEPPGHEDHQHPPTTIIIGDQTIEQPWYEPIFLPRGVYQGFWYDPHDFAVHQSRKWWQLVRFIDGKWQPWAPVPKSAKPTTIAGGMVSIAMTCINPNNDADQSNESKVEVVDTPGDDDDNDDDDDGEDQ